MQLNFFSIFSENKSQSIKKEKIISPTAPYTAIQNEGEGVVKLMWLVVMVGGRYDMIIETV